MNKWPKLSYPEWIRTKDTLHRWLQIVGKVRMSKMPWINHDWSTTLYVSSRGLTTGLIPDRDRSFSIESDFVAHRLLIQTTDGQELGLAFQSEPVSSFYRRFCQALSYLGIESRFAARPDETVDRIPFEQDDTHRTYVSQDAHRFWQALLRVENVLQEFRSRFVGKSSPVHFFWGSLDLAVTRFSGKRAPEHPGGIPNLADDIVKEAYSHEVCSAGFWPGNEIVPFPAFYSYAYPQPVGFEKSQFLPKEAFYHDKLREFILPYEVVQASSRPEELLLSFLQSTYEAAADLGAWDRSLLEESHFLELMQQKHRKVHQRERAA